MKFVLDEMLGRSSRWLRILGYEASYLKSSDDDLLEVAKREGGILLTRDLELFRRAKTQRLEVFFVEGKDEAEKLANVSKRFNIKLDINMADSHCPICGSSIKRAEKSEVFNKVPKGTLKYYDKFWMCMACKKVYWHGSHWKKINEILSKAKSLRIKQIK